MVKIILALSILVLGFYIKNDDPSEYFNIANEKLKIHNPSKKDYVVVIDFRKHLLSNRLYLLDMRNKEVILNCRVTHAKKSGNIFATEFSNEPQSEKSSYGTFITKYSRPGRYGYSMVISGLDKGINDNVEKRVVIFHPTRVLWSKGCFATSESNNKIIIDHMKNGRLIHVIK